jgi:hypothetical protein
MTVPLTPLQASKESFSSLTVSNNLKFGALVPRGNMFEGVWAILLFFYLVN